MADEELRGRESRQRPPREITVSEAAGALRVSERTVLNFIKEKRIKAVKVGKKWFVDAQSVRELAAGGGRSGMVPGMGGDFSVNAANSEFSAFAEKSEIAEPKIRKNFSANSENSEKSENTEIAEKGSGDSTLPRGRGSRGLRHLSCFCLAADLFSRPTWQTSIPEAGESGLIGREILLERLVQLQCQVLESLGAGYHSFHLAKVQHYGKARAAAGSLLALLYAQENRLCDLKDERGALEFKLIPALVALHRSVEKRGRAA